MIEIVEIPHSGSIKELAAKIRPQLGQRNVVRVPGFSSNQDDMNALGAQLGILGQTTPVLISNIEYDPGKNFDWTRSGLTQHQRIPDHSQKIIIEYCVQPTGFIRWFTDLCDLFAMHPQEVVDQHEASTATFADRDGTTIDGSFLRIEKLTGRSYLCATSELIRVDSSSEAETAEFRQFAANYYGYGTGDPYYDQAGDLLIYGSDGVAVGRLASESVPGRWAQIRLSPDWDLIRI